MTANRAASVLARLKNRARADGEDLQYVLVRYANERLLYRLSVSEAGRYPTPGPTPSRATR